MNSISELPAGTRDEHYDVIVCGSGSSGSVVARRLSDNPDVRVLLIEAGGTDDVPNVLDPLAWPSNLGSERDWGFIADPNPQLNGRAIPMSMGKVLGGGSSINVMVWARGHQSDWDHYAAATGDEGWGYAAATDMFRRIEDWQGASDPAHRGEGGPVHVQSAPAPGPVAGAMLDAARTIGIPVFASQNGAMMEGAGGCAPTDIILRNGRRHSIYRAYVEPVIGRPNLTVLTHVTVTRVLIEKGVAVGVEATNGDRMVRYRADREVVLSLGAIQTPKVLMLSGIGDEHELAHHGLAVIQHLPGVGRNLQDHVAFGCIWAYREPTPPRNSGSEATLYWKSDPGLTSPDLLFCQAEFPVPSAETAHRGVPDHGWTMFAGLARPHSRGRVRLGGADGRGAPRIELNTLSEPADLAAAIRGVELAQELGSTPALRALSHEIVPGPITGPALESFVRDAAVTYWHQSCSAKMGLDAMSVVDPALHVYGVRNLRIADASVFPRIPTGNLMAPCVLVGERAAVMIRREHAM